MTLRWIATRHPSRKTDPPENNNVGCVQSRPIKLSFPTPTCDPAQVDSQKTLAIRQRKIFSKGKVFVQFVFCFGGIPGSLCCRAVTAWWEEPENLSSQIGNSSADMEVPSSSWGIMIDKAPMFSWKLIFAEVPVVNSSSRLRNGT